MSESMIAAGVYSRQDFLSGETMDRADETVVDVFRGMLGIPIEAIENVPYESNPLLNERTAIVGFAGSMRGSCEIRMSSSAVQALASAMMGGSAEEQADDMLDDTIGELCNMVGGGWKDRIPAHSSSCTLSPPTVISGHEYKVHMTKPSVKLSRTYKFGDHLMYLTLHREDTPAD